MSFMGTVATSSGQGGGVSLQATLSASSAGTPTTGQGVPHHPITCSGELRYLEDGSLACPHATIPPDDMRTRHCIDHSIALLLIELVHDL